MNPSHTAARRPVNRLALVLSVATGIRLVYFLTFLNSPCDGFLFADHIYYREWALSIRDGNWVGEAAFEQGPLYAYLLAVGFLIGLSERAIILLQLMTGVAVTLLVYRCGQRLFDDRVATVAALVTAAYGPLLHYQSELMKSWLSPLLVVLTLYLGLRYAESLRVRWAVLAGLTIGLACLVRESYLLLIVPTVAWVWTIAAGQKTRRARAAHVFALVGSLGLTLVPSAVRNYKVTGEFVLVTTGGGEVMYIAHGPKADGYWNFGALDTTKLNPRQEHQGYRDEAERRVGHPLTAAESSRYWTREARREIAENVGRTLRLTGLRARIVLNDFEVHDSADYYTWRASIPLLYLAPTFGWIVALGLLGMVVHARDWRRYGLAVGLVAMVGLAVLVTYNFGRFRIGMTPIWILFASAGLFRLVAWWRSNQGRDRMRAAVATAACLLVTVLAFRPPPGAENVYSAADREAWQKQMNDRQKARLRAAKVASNPNPDAQVHSELGHEFLAAGRIREGMHHYRSAMALAPADARYAVAFSRNLFGNGYEAESIDLVREAIQIDSEYGSAAAYQLLVHAVKERPDLLRKFGRPLAEVGEQACAATQRDNPVLLYTLAVVYARTDRVPEAVATAEQGLAQALQKGDQPTAAALRQLLDHFGPRGMTN